MQRSRLRYESLVSLYCEVITGFVQVFVVFSSMLHKYLQRNNASRAQKLLGVYWRMKQHTWWYVICELPSEKIFCWSMVNIVLLMPTVWHWPCFTASMMSGLTSSVAATKVYLLCHIYPGVPHQCAALFSLGLLQKWCLNSDESKYCRNKHVTQTEIKTTSKLRITNECTCLRDHKLWVCFSALMTRQYPKKTIDLNIEVNNNTSMHVCTFFHYPKIQRFIY